MSNDEVLRVEYLELGIIESVIPLILSSLFRLGRRLNYDEVLALNSTLVILLHQFYSFIEG